jgi:hypothetical protein
MRKCHSFAEKPRIRMNFYDFCKIKTHSRELLDRFLVILAYLSFTNSFLFSLIEILTVFCLLLMRVG